jgi:hypothetical protein
VHDLRGRRGGWRRCVWRQPLSLWPAKTRYITVYLDPRSRLERGRRHGPKEISRDGLDSWIDDDQLCVFVSIAVMRIALGECVSFVRTLQHVHDHVGAAAITNELHHGISRQPPLPLPHRCCQISRASTALRGRCLSSAVSTSNICTIMILIHMTIEHGSLLLCVQGTRLRAVGVGVTTLLAGITPAPVAAQSRRRR